MNEAIFNPEDHILVVMAKVEDMIVDPHKDGTITIAIENFTGGIEIVSDNDRLWWPA